MTNNDNHVYFNFPIEIIKDAFDDIKKTCNNIISYAIYDRFINLEFGDDEQKMETTFDFFGITNPSWQSSLSSAKKVFDKIGNHSVKTGIKKELAFQFRDEYKSNYDISVFIAFCSLRSILGSKPYTKCNNDYLIARMAGFATIGELEQGLSDQLNKFTARYQLDKIKKDLDRNWGLKYYSRQTRGFYISFDLPLKELIKIGEVNRKKYQNKKANAEKKQLLNEVLKEIN
jgi:hypothetical protein